MNDAKQRFTTVLEKSSDIRTDGFVTSQNLMNHPVLKSKPKIRALYYAALEYFVKACSTDSVYTDARLAQYRRAFAGNQELVLTESNRNVTIKRIVNDAIRPWRRKYRYWLFCDVALTLLDEQAIAEAQKRICVYLNQKQIRFIKELSETIREKFAAPIPADFGFAADLITQYRANRTFISLPEKRIMVTANMSAGKSTLVNALVGKPVTRTSQEACTANLCYIFNKPFEDGAIHLRASPLNLSANYDDLGQAGKADVSCIASFFRAFAEPRERICIIDTPGANSAINREHGELSRTALREKNYDKLVYVLNANRLGTEEEHRYLTFVSKNVPEDKIIFVLNKLDDFNKAEDSVEDSIEGVRNDLMSLGYETPIICPISAYFALLVKMKQNGESLTEDENEEYALCAKKFLKPEYDLSRYHDTQGWENAGQDDLTILAVRSGLYGFENILYGGMAER
jgi:GTP-binding protein EngB required for normal cell division